MKIIHKLFAVCYSGIIVLFILLDVSLVFFAVLGLWHALSPYEALSLRERFNEVLESIGLLTIAVIALELSQTILEEEGSRRAC